MDRPKTSPKDFFLWAGAMVALYTSAVAFISLIFDYLNWAYPDALSYYPVDPYAGSISYEMATLIVLFPLFLVLMRVIHRTIEEDSSRAEIWVRRWALYLTLFVAGATVAVDLITLIMNFLSGDVTLRFVMKVAIVLLIAGAGFLHFLADLRGYWKAEPQKARQLGWATGVLVAITVISGFLIVGTPWTARLYRLDETKLQNLQEIQMQVVTYWQGQGRLPANIDMLADAISGYEVPTDPQTGRKYEYAIMGPVMFQLCATFNEPSQPGQFVNRPAPAYPGSMGQTSGEIWAHDKGRTCFLRTIDPNRYPVNKNKGIGPRV